MSGIAGIIGGAGSLLNLFGGGGSNNGGYTNGSTAPVGYVPTGQGSADSMYQNIFQRLYGAGAGEYGSVLPQYRQISSDMLNNPYAQSYLKSANNAGTFANQTLSPMYQQGGQSLFNAGQGALPFSTSILNMGFDPQNALYDRTLNRLNDSIGVNLARTGVTGPAAAGIANQAVSDFNLDWRNNQLQRANNAITGYGNLINSAGRGIGGGADIAGQSLPLMTNAGSLPYSTYNSILGNNLSTLNNIGSFSNQQYSLPIQTANLLQSYMGLGQTGNQNASNAALNQFYQNQALGNQLGSAIGQIGNAWGSPSSWFSSPATAGGGGLPGYSDPSMSNYATAFNPWT